MDMTPGSKHNDEHDEAQKKVFRGYGFRPGGKNMHIHSEEPHSLQVQSDTLLVTNMAPETKPFQNESSLPTINFLVLC